MNLTKMQGLGNDYLYIYGEIENPQEVSVKLSDRHFGIGSDGIIIIAPSEIADFKMRIFNADGSEAKMCGNGIRCLAKYAADKKYAKTKAFKIETLAGVLPVRGGYDNDGDFMATINMGSPIFEDSIEIDGMTVYSVNTGVPHAVVFVDDVEAVDIDALAPKIRHHEHYKN